MNNHKRIAALLSTAMMLATATNPASLLTANAESDVHYGPIHVVPNSMEIEKSDTSFLKEYPEGQTLKFSAARNERESGQIVIHSDVNIDAITVNTAPLKNENNVALNAKVDVFFEQYLTVLSNDWWITNRNGNHAEPLLPYEMAIDENVNLNKLDTTNGGNQGIWFTVTVPDNAKAGTYSGNFTVTLDKEVCTVPVELTVYDFDMPEKTKNNLFLNDFMATTEAVYNGYAGYPAVNGTSDAYADDLSAFLEERRINTGWMGEKWPSFNSMDVTEEQIDAKKDAFAEAVLNYVENSPSPYYNLEPSYGGNDIKAPFVDLDFTLPTAAVLRSKWDEYKSQEAAYDAELKKLKDNGATAQELDAFAAENKPVHPTLSKAEKESLLAEMGTAYEKIEPVLTQLLGVKELTDTQKAALKFVTDTYLYFDIKYGTGLLSDDEKQYIGISLSSWNSSNYTQNIVGKNEPDLGKISEMYYKYNKDNIGSFLKRLSFGLQAYLTSDRKLSSKQQVEVLQMTRYLRTGQTRYSQYDYNSWEHYYFGMESVLEAIAKKSLESGTDLLQYAYFYSPFIDEVQPTSFWDAYNALMASKVLDNSKEKVKKYIDNYTDPDVSLTYKQQLKDSLDHLYYIPTNSPVDNKTYTYRDSTFEAKNVYAYYAILTHGMEYFLGEDASAFYQDNYAFKTIDPTKSDYVCLEGDYALKCFCPLYNDFTYTKYPKCAWEVEAKDVNAAMRAAEDENLHLWWYNCMGNGNPASAAFILAGNRGEYYYGDKSIQGDKINMNSLAVTRANKWQAFALGIEGELYWAVDQYYEQSKMWEKESSSANEGALVYPIYALLCNTLGMDNDKAQEFIEKYGEHFASGIRLENIAESGDDYDYLYMAEQGVMQHPEFRERLNNIISSIIEVGNVDYTNETLTNSENIAKAKHELAMLIQDCNSMDVQEVLPTTKHSFAVPQVKNWHGTGKMLCFDICETDTVSTDGNRKFSISFADDDSNRLSELLTVDFATKTISGCDEAYLLSHNNGWYTVQIPLMYVPLNTSGNLYQANGKETLTKVYFQYINCSFDVSNFCVYQEVNYEYPSNFSNYFPFSNTGVPEVKKWNQSSKILSFDVCPTHTYIQGETNQTVSVSLMKGWTRISGYLKLDFANLTVIGCEGAEMISRRDGWFTVRIPLKNVPLNTSEDEEADGTETLNAIHFRDGSDWLGRSFLMDNIKVYQEITDMYNDVENFSNRFAFSDYDIPEVKEWNTSGAVLCFDVCKTDTINTDIGTKTAQISLMHNWTRLNSYMVLDFEKMTVSNCKDAKMVPKGNGWYTVQIPLNNVLLNTSKDEEADGKETLNSFHFRNDYVHASFLVDHIKVLHDFTNDYNTPNNFLNRVTLAEFGAPDIKNWKTSDQILCFDVYETNTYRQENGNRIVYLSMMENWRRLNGFIQLDFANLRVNGCENAKMISNGNGWYTVQIPLNDVKLNTSENEGSDGTETLNSIHFRNGTDWFQTSFMLDNIKVYQAPKADAEIVAPSTVIHGAPKKTNSCDINDDGRDSIADAVLLSRYVGEDNTITMPEAGKSRVDCNGDGIVDMSDVVKILRVIARLD